MKIKRSQIIISVLLLCVLLFGGIVRFYTLGDIPSGLTNDEASIGYDAYSIAKTGKDQWGETLPFPSFKGFGDQRPALYTYIAVVPVGLFGLHAWAIRLPSAILGMFTIILTYLVTAEIMKKKSIALLAAFLVAINPWAIGMSRVGIESNASIPFILLGLYFFLLCHTHRFFLFFSVFSFIIAVYMYTANIIFVPLFFLFLLFWNRTMLGTPFMKRTSVLAILLFAFLFIPLITTNLSTARSRITQVNITQDKGIVAVLDEKRGACQKIYPNGLCKILFNKPILFTFKALTNYIEHFSPELLSLSGTTTQFSILPARGLLFVSEYILFIIGVIYFILSKQEQKGIIFGWLLLAPIADSITGSGHYSRYIISEPVWQILAAYGLYSLFQNRKTVSVGIIFAALCCFEFFQGAFEYNTYFPTYYSRYSHFGYKELTDKLLQEKQTYDAIYVSSAVNDTKQYIFYLWYGAVDPMEFQKGNGVEKTTESNGWVRVRRIGNVYFVPTFPETDSAIRKEDKKILYIGAPSEFPKVSIPSQFEIRDKRGDILFEGITVYDWKRCLETDCREDGK